MLGKYVVKKGKKKDEKRWTSESERVGWWQPRMARLLRLR
jgi:hypothetical protein